MWFKSDENLPVEAAELLRAAGHDAATVLDQKMGGAPDEPDLGRLDEKAAGGAGLLRAGLDTMGCRN